MSSSPKVSETWKRTKKMNPTFTILIRGRVDSYKLLELVMQMLMESAGFLFVFHFLRWGRCFEFSG